MRLSRKLMPLLFTLTMLAAPLSAQTEADLKAFFEGKRVVIKLDLPATSEGVDVSPTGKPDVNFAEQASRVRTHGAAIRSGDEVTVTKIRVKNDLIEFQLDGGGFTFWDAKSTTVNYKPAPKSEREKALEQDLARETDSYRRQQLARQLDDARRSREREDEYRRREAREESERLRDEQLRRKLASGSRFNLRYAPRVPADALTPQGVMNALARYVEFPAATFPGAPASESPRAAESRDARPSALTDAPAAAPSAQLRKGMTRQEVEAILGPARTASEKTEGSLKVVTCTYQQDREHIVEAVFIDGVLVRYTISSQ
jgi:hypothetical protein